MSYQIEIREHEPVRVAYMNYKGIVTDANKIFPNVFKSIRGRTNGAPFFRYLSINPENKQGQMELCVPTTETPIGNGVEIKELPRTKALCITHIGPYETLTDAYAVLDKYAAENNLIVSPPLREVFIKGPGMVLKGNPNKYITEIQFPIKEE